MAWPQILVIFFVGFICGACWMRSRYADLRQLRAELNRRTALIQSAVDYALIRHAPLSSAGRSRGTAART